MPQKYYFFLRIAKYFRKKYILFAYMRKNQYFCGEKYKTMKTRIGIYALLIGVVMIVVGCSTKNSPSGGSGGGGSSSGESSSPIKCPKYVQIETDGGSTVVTIKSTMSWEASADKDWISLDPTEGERGETDVEITVKAGEQEQGLIIFRAMSGSEQKMKVYRGEIPDGENPDDPEDPENPEEGETSNISETLIGPEMLYNSVYGSEYTFTISSETDWELTEDIKWMTFSPTSGEAGKDIVISAVAEGGHHAFGIIYVHNDKDKISFPSYRGYLPSEGDYDVKPTEFPTKIEGCLPGLFRISRTQQVYFSKGNLHYFKGNWSFADYQYIIGLEGNGEDPLADKHPMDLFGWGTSGWESGATAYLPTSSGYEDDDYAPGGDIDADLRGEYAKADWGVYNAISNGGNQPRLWRVLTAEEWMYIARERPHWADLCASATVEDVPGIILLPDNWDWEKWDGKLITDHAGFEQNILSAGELKKFEQDGAVFLPGFNHNSNHYSSTYGAYWSTDHVNRTDAYVAAVVTSGMEVRNSGRSSGCCVRLVRAD